MYLALKELSLMQDFGGFKEAPAKGYVSDKTNDKVLQGVNGCDCKASSDDTRGVDSETATYKTATTSEELKP